MVGHRNPFTAVLGALVVACGSGASGPAPNAEASASGGRATLDGSATSGGQGGASAHLPIGGDGGGPGAGGSGGSSVRDASAAETGAGGAAPDGGSALDAGASAGGAANLDAATSPGGSASVDAGAGGAANVDAGRGGSPARHDAGTGGSNGAGGATADAGGPSGTPPSCEGLPSTCGPLGDEDCCASPLVRGGTFSLSYDAVTYTNPVATATVSDFRLDRFEITVGRFRRFVGAWVSGWRPAAGSGKHTHLNAGQGLAATGGGYEPGWYASSSFSVPTTSAQWDTGLTPNATFQTWTSTPGANEARPINYATWVELYAFCIWDGGFLPSEAEWNYAAAGGAEQRAYPWSVPSTSTTLDCTLATYDQSTQIGSSFCSPTYTSLVGALSPEGDGKYGQADLSGNMAEWVLDLYAPYTIPCTDCTNATAGTKRVHRGGAFLNSDAGGTLLVSYRGSDAASTRYDGAGARCARAP